MKTEVLKHTESRGLRITKREVIGIAITTVGFASLVVAGSELVATSNNIKTQVDNKYPPVSDHVIGAASNEITLFDQKINLSISQGNSLSSALTSEEATKFNQDEQILTETAQRDEYDTQLSAKSIKEKLASIGMPLGFVIAMGGLVTSVTKSKR